VNGYGFAIDRFIREMENIAVAVADNKIGRPLLLKIMESFLYEESFSEEIQLELIEAF
jgi:death-on-curing protein